MLFYLNQNNLIQWFPLSDEEGAETVHHPRGTHLIECYQAFHYKFY